MNSIPSNYNKVYILCDTYEDMSIKSFERQMRGAGERCILKNPDMKLPYDINKYLSVGKNKEELFNIIKDAIKSDYMRKDCTVYFCLRDCYQLKKNEVILRPDLFSDHEEADTKLIAYAKLANSSVMIRSPSGDIDVIALFSFHFSNSNVKVYIDNGTGAQRKLIDVSSCGLTLDQSSALLGLHSFSGNDYVSSFFRKGKKTCWKKMIAKANFIDAFSKLGSTYHIDDKVHQVVEQYVCSLYGKGKLKSVNEVRSSIFWDKYSKKKKIVELCLLPPCYENLTLHLKRSNYIAYIFRHAHCLIMDLESSLDHGWVNGGVQWTSNYFPSHNSDVLLQSNEDDDNDELTEEDAIDDDDDIAIEDFN